MQNTLSSNIQLQRFACILFMEEPHRILTTSLTKQFHPEKHFILSQEHFLITVLQWPSCYLLQQVTVVFSASLRELFYTLLYQRVNFPPQKECLRPLQPLSSAFYLPSLVQWLMYSQIQEAEQQFCILHSSVDTLHDLAKWNTTSEPKVLCLEIGNNNPYVSIKKHRKLQIKSVLQTLYTFIIPYTQAQFLVQKGFNLQYRHCLISHIKSFLVEYKTSDLH